jgi:hypothetical protein
MFSKEKSLLLSKALKEKNLLVLNIRLHLAFTKELLMIIKTTVFSMLILLPTQIEQVLVIKLQSLVMSIFNSQ